MPRARKVREEAAVVRDRVERSALRLFALHGSPAVSVQAIADSVAMSKQAVLYHYGSKDAIRAAVLRRVTHWARDQIQAFTADGPAWTLGALTDRVFEAYVEHPFIPGVILREVLEDPEQAGLTLQEGTLPWRDQVGGIIEGAQEAGLVRADLDAQRYLDRIALMLLSTLALPPCTTATARSGPEAAEVRSLIRETLRIALVSALTDPTPVLEG